MTDVHWWHFFLVSVGIFNILMWFFASHWFRQSRGSVPDDFYLNRRWQLWLSGVYVFVCAFRGFLPRADVQKIVLFDTYLSSIFVGRTVATLAELCFVAQWALILREMGRGCGEKKAVYLSFIVFPVIVIAECFSWYAVITTNFGGNAIEESLWAVSALIMLAGLFFVWKHYYGSIRKVLAAGALAGVLYFCFMAFVDVPMYYGRWKQDTAAGKTYHGFSDGVKELQTKWTVTWEPEDWEGEKTWMALYFSLAVWMSISFIHAPRFALEADQKPNVSS